MKASITPAKPAVTKTIVVSPAVPETVTLEMTREEAQFIRNLFSTIGGCPRSSERRHVSAISERLAHAGFDFEEDWAHKHKVTSLYFQD